MDSADKLISYPFVIVRIACTRCSRKGSYRLARLAERYGAEIRMPELLALLSGDCVFRGNKRFAGSYETCGAVYSDLGTPPTPPDLPPTMARLKVVKGGRH